MSVSALRGAPVLCSLLRRETRGGAVQCRLRGPADRAPADGAAAAAGEGGRVGLHPRRRPGVQAAELDEPAVHAARGARAVDGDQQGRRAAADHPGAGAARLLARARHRPGPGQGRGRGGPAAAAGRADHHPGRRLPAGPPGAPHRDRPGRHPLPGRRRRQRGGGDQAPGRDRRRRAAHPLPGADEPGPRPHPRSVASSPPSPSPRRPASWPPTAASPASPSTTTPCAASTTPPPACSSRWRCGGRWGGPRAGPGRGTGRRCASS